MTDYFSTLGEQAQKFRGECGVIEAISLTPASACDEYMAVLCHPHSLFGGTMNNKVVTTVARTLRDLGIASLRFNCRGVGESEGEFDNGVGESRDLLLIIAALAKAYPHKRLILAGFSFGSYVAYRAACKTDNALLVTIAPSVENFNYTEFDSVPSPWLALVPMADEVVSATAAVACLEKIHPTPALITFADTSHFFHKKLPELKHALSEKLTESLSLG